MKKFLTAVILALVLTTAGSCTVEADLDTTEQEVNLCPLPPGEHRWFYWSTLGSGDPFINRATYTNFWYETCNTAVGLPGTSLASWRVVYEMPGYIPLSDSVVRNPCVSCVWF